MTVPAYINGMGIISPQLTEGEIFLANPADYKSERLNCHEPDYNQWIDMKQQRRMGKIVKMGVASAFQAMKEANVETPDAIITGTGLGCLEDTATFLKKLTTTEEMLNPTPFIQSTHNTIGSQVALLINCQNYNQTYSHRALSFESSLTDAMMMLEENPSLQVLTGAADEITNESHEMQRQLQLFRQDNDSSLNLFLNEGNGTLHGEGAAYFSLSTRRGEKCYARIEEVTTLFKPSNEEFENALEKFLNKNQLRLNDIDFLLSGRSGDSRSDHMLNLVTGKFPPDKVGMFKHLCGEYSTAVAFATWAAAKILYHQTIPGIICATFKKQSLKNVLIVNQYCGTYYSLILLTSCHDT